jgi:hypothetical protein
MYLYIMGRAHCGSTILGIVLGGGGTIESVGELVSGLERYGKQNEICSCRQLMDDGCPFWAEVRRHFEAEGYDWAELARASRHQTDVRSWPGTWLAGRSDPSRRRLGSMTAAIARAIARASGKPHVLDSNKETTRALFLVRFLPEAHVIHLLRDPRAVQQSHWWRICAGRGFHFMRRKYGVGRCSAPLLILLGAVSWLVGSALAELVHKAAPDRVLRLRYEDLRDNPAAAVRMIGAALGVPVEDVAARLDQGQTLTIGHQVGGNDIRYAGEIRFDREAGRNHPPLPRWAELVTVAVCWPLMRRYGYTGPRRLVAASRDRTHYLPAVAEPTE